MNSTTIFSVVLVSAILQVILKYGNIVAAYRKGIRLAPFKKYNHELKKRQCISGRR